VTTDAGAAVIAYWDAAGVRRYTIACRDSCGDNEFSQWMLGAGLPIQGWWSFRFGAPPAFTEGYVVFGSLGDDWSMQWCEGDGRCRMWGGQGEERYGNRSMAAFSQCLVAFDRGFKQVQAECLGDSGEDWEKGNAIVAATESELRAIDSEAFTHEQNLWPCLLVDING
jgi:SUKH-4 immunity protein